MQLDTFARWSVLHLAALTCCAVAIAALLLLGRHWRIAAPPKEWALGLAWVGSVLIFQTYAQIWWALPAHFLHDASMPLHICDVVIWFAPFALIWRRRLACTFLYFWGVGLSANAFFYPTIVEGPTRIEFWLYWIGHLQIVGTGLYIVVVRSYRPRLRDVLIAIAGLLVYFAIVLPIDWVLDVDYGYLGQNSAIASVLGPWPMRVLVLFGLQVAVFLLLWVLANLGTARPSRVLG
jgi:hypothetical integral membrane protein (TIGR02206 family)